MSMIRKELSDKELLKTIVENPSGYQVVFHSDRINVYDKASGDSYELKDPAEGVLSELLSIMGVETDFA